MLDTYTCPVCGFGELELPPEDHTICPSCGTQFGYDDVGHTHRELRNLWLRHGGRWFNTECPQFLKQRGWNAWDQLDAALLPYDVPRVGGRNISYDIRVPGNIVETTVRSGEILCQTS
jgi:hypothetical protein